jgi:hypothetical protein
MAGIKAVSSPKRLSPLCFQPSLAERLRGFFQNTMTLGVEHLSSVRWAALQTALTRIFLGVSGRSSRRDPHDMEHIANHYSGARFRPSGSLQATRNAEHQKNIGKAQEMVRPACRTLLTTKSKVNSYTWPLIRGALPTTRPNDFSSFARPCQPFSRPIARAVPRRDVCRRGCWRSPF